MGLQIDGAFKLHKIQSASSEQTLRLSDLSDSRIFSRYFEFGGYEQIVAKIWQPKQTAEFGIELCGARWVSTTLPP